MHNGQKVVDVHGHMTTPAGFRQFLAEIVSQNTPGRKLEVTDEQLASRAATPSANSWTIATSTSN